MYEYQRRKHVEARDHSLGTKHAWFIADDPSEAGSAAWLKTFKLGKQFLIEPLLRSAALVAVNLVAVPVGQSVHTCDLSRMQS
jgi:hypothetical protein